MNQAAAAGLGVYLHIPFCLDRCTYCSFATTRDQSLLPEVVAKLHADLQAWGTALGSPKVETLYFGGGTPTVLSPETLVGLLDTLCRSFTAKERLETTFEANPGTVTGAGLQVLRRAGFDRISLGIQTLDDGLLQSLGRIHDRRQALQALDWARTAGFQRISADLLLGIPDQTPATVVQDAKRLIEAGVEHLSIYLLDLDKACPMSAAVAAGRVLLPDEDSVADTYEALQEMLPLMGFQAYEISNHARAGAESLHNTRYWLRKPYLGLGPSAASHLEPWRWTECSNLKAWLQGAAPEECHPLSPEAALAEVPLLALRRAEGMDWSQLRTMAEQQGLVAKVDEWERALRRFEDAQWILRTGSHIRLSARGMLMSNQVFGIFLD